MAGIVGRSLTYNVPNYVGELYLETPTDTKFVSSIAALSGGESTSSTVIQWTAYDLRDAQNRPRAEGDDAPSAEARVRRNIRNVPQIFHETVDTSYTKQAATGLLSDTNSNHPHGAGTAGDQVVQNEHAWQTSNALRQLKRDMEIIFLRGKLVDPANNNTNRETRGLIDATESNRKNVGTEIDTFTVTVANPGVFTTATAHGLVVGDQVQFVEGSGALPDSTDLPMGRFEEGVTYYVVTQASTTTFELATSPGGTAIEVTGAGTTHATRLAFEAAAWTKDDLLDLMQDVYTSGGIQEEETATVMCNAWNKRRLTEIFVSDSVYRQSSRTVGGVSVDTIITDFGELNIMLNRHFPNGALQVVSLEECAPVHLEIPGKGFLFIERLGKAGSRDEDQIYGEAGLKWGNEKAHGLLHGASASATS